MYSKGRISETWDMQEVESLAYFYEPFNDVETVGRWTQQYNMSFSIGMQADWRVEQPAFVQTVLANLAKQDIVLHKPGTSFYRMNPGDILPRHQDQYTSYCQYHNVEPEQVWRAIVFLQQWNPGFLFEIEQTPVVQYPAGTFVLWNYDAPHMAGNLGSVPRYTLQITGIRDVQ